MDRVGRTVEAKREQHPELRTAVSYQDLLSVCNREGITVRHGPLPTAGVAISHGENRIIGLSTLGPVRFMAYALAHEMAHIWMHGDDEPAVYHMIEPWPDDPREDEAEYLATILLQGLPANPPGEVA